MLKTKGRIFDGDTTTDLGVLKERARDENPELSDIELEAEARRLRNFNKAHLKAYMQGKQIFFFGRDKFKRQIAHVVQAKRL